MSAADTVTVFNFQVFDPASEGYRVASFKAPPRVIVERYRGEVLPGTAEEVEAAALDSEGRYRRIASGWGSLN